MPLPKPNTYTVEDIYLLPEGQRAELIDGQIYNMAPPSPLHQKLVMELSATIRNYIKSNSGSCEVYPAPFAVFLPSTSKSSFSIIKSKNSFVCGDSSLYIFCPAARISSGVPTGAGFPFVK